MLKAAFYKTLARHRARRRFNCGTQARAPWRKRAEVAVDLVESAIAKSEGFSLADFGCGDQKVRAILQDRGLSPQYIGFDLHPQSRDTIQLDLQKDAIPGRYDFATLLGVMEYISEPVHVLEKIRSTASFMVVSLVASDGESISSALAKEKNWQKLPSQREFEVKLRASGWRIVETRMTPNHPTRLWLCQSHT